MVTRIISLKDMPIAIATPYLNPLFMLVCIMAKKAGPKEIATNNPNNAPSKYSVSIFLKIKTVANIPKRIGIS